MFHFIKLDEGFKYNTMMYSAKKSKIQLKRKVLHETYDKQNTV